jgi:hypothetical protein
MSAWLFGLGTVVKKIAINKAKAYYLKLEKEVSFDRLVCENLLYCGNCHPVDCRERDDSYQYAWLCSLVWTPCTLHTVIHLRALSQGAQGQCLLEGACPMVLSCYIQQRQK